ncbi:MAG: asparagine synthase (glutamine-hydrolyzing) [Alphaproteobacteria bacterium]|nr:asparagine synthase (glutamine-hydrolyzing) [Alphaproteobacteria bacterium]
MCGIAGIALRDNATPDPAILDRLAKALSHRGPDGEGRYLGEGIGLVQVRLAIIDLEGGRQPLYEPQGAVLVGNGEIYNYRELASDLPDVTFKTGSDCEPPLHLWRRADSSYAQLLRGMYALAIYDPASRRLTLSRDPFGIKPLYWAETAQGVVFASEAQALIAAGLVEARENPKARDELLQLQFTTGAETIFSGIHRLLPGETLVIEKGLVVQRHRLNALPAAGILSSTTDQFLYELDQVLAESVSFHQRSDVPYGMFLSGGIDSSALLALMARLNERPVLAFTAHFPGSGAKDERGMAARVAKEMKAERIDVAFTEDDFWQLAPEVAAAMDDPAADYACLPTYKLAREARKHVKVILSGEGGDELFAGYGRYRQANRPWPFRRSMRRHGTFDNLGVLRENPLHWRDGIAASERQEELQGRTKLQTAQAVDCADWLPNDLLTKLDRCLMAHGVEGRVPFLDPLVAAFAFKLPDAMKIHKGLGKWAMRLWLDKVLPPSGAFEKKRGFTVPVGDWIAAKGHLLGPLVASQPAIRALCYPKEVERLFAHANQQGFAAWTLLFYALWHGRHMLGHRPQGDVFDNLDAMRCST